MFFFLLLLIIINNMYEHFITALNYVQSMCTSYVPIADFTLHVLLSRWVMDRLAGFEYNWQQVKAFRSCRRKQLEELRANRGGEPREVGKSPKRSSLRKKVNQRRRSPGTKMWERDARLSLGGSLGLGQTARSSRAQSGSTHVRLQA